MDDRQVAIYLGRVRVAKGMLLMVSPRAALRPVLGSGLESPAAGVTARGVGASEVILGVGVSISAGERLGSANWMSMCAASDALGAVAFLLTPGLPRRARLVGLMAAASAVLHFRVARVLSQAS